VDRDGDAFTSAIAETQGAFLELGSEFKHFGEDIIITFRLRRPRQAFGHDDSIGDISLRELSFEILPMTDAEDECR
jgi:hypothetical protein